jgi:hypothetical protein
VGILLLLAGLMVYAGVIMGLSPWIGALPILAQAPVYLVRTIWLLPLRRF